MERRPLPSVATANGASRFELAPPRRFVLPAVLLLVAEEPGHGYGLAKRLRDLRFGHLDRPAVYRALAQLEADGLIEGGVAESNGGRSGRRVYHTTELGERVLRLWMGVIQEEHQRLAHVLQRYRATATGEAVLAEVEGGWAAALGYGGSRIYPTGAGRHRLTPVGDLRGATTAWARAGAGPAAGAEPVAGAGPAAGAEPVAGAEPAGGAGPPLPSAEMRPTPAAGPASTPPRRLQLLPERSVVLVEVRSTAGPLSFGSMGLTGTIDVGWEEGGVAMDPPPAARVTVDVTRLRSGHQLYDAELLRRIDAPRFPTATVELRRCAPGGPGPRFLLEGDLTFHGVTRPVWGTVQVERDAGGRLVVDGEQSLDIRDFAIPAPTVLMLRIYPDVRVLLHVEAEESGPEEE